MNRRLTLVTVLVLLVIIGMVAGLFTGSIQKALSAPMGGLVNQAPAAVPTTPKPAKPGAVGATPAPGMTQGNGVNTLAQDTFQRQNQPFWGTATDGRMWGGDANKANGFSIANGVGQIANTQGAVNALLGQAGTNMEVMVSGSLNQFNNGQVNLGVVLRWTDGQDWYKVLIDGTNVKMVKRVKGVSTTLASMPFQAQGGKAYALRFRAIGAMLFARVWLVGTPEPQNWMLNVTDMALPTGQAGIRVLLLDETIANITAFSVSPAATGNVAATTGNIA